MKLPAQPITVALAIFALAIASFAIATVAQRARNRAQVHAMQASSDHGKMLSATFTLATPATITCLNATSEVPNGTPAPACHIVANGFNGTMSIKSSATLKPGDITLTCIGAGGFLRCDARVDIPSPTTSPTP
jgi:hypothetical protein